LRIAAKHPERITAITRGTATLMSKG
jgi:hypothetical protein